MPYEAEKLVIGCGNVLFKDDGFGYYVIKAIDEYFGIKSENDTTNDSYDPFSLPEENWNKIIEALNERLKIKEKPDETLFIDAGMSSTYDIFSLLNEKWKKIIVVDIVAFGAEPGTLKYFSPYEIPRGKYENAHSWPIEEPLQDLTEKMDIEIKIVGCQPAEVSSPDVVVGLTEPVEKAIPEAVEMILKEL